MTQADLRAATAEPLVKAAVEILHGVVVDVRREAAPTPPEAPRAEAPPRPVEE